jgi:peptidoglycan lytic transglycosylase G
LRTILTLLLATVLAVAAWLAYGLLLPTGPTGEEKFVLLRPGSSARHIALTLKNAGVIRSAPAFLAWHYWRGLPTLKAGEYKFDHPADARQVYARIFAGDIYVHTVVIPEGYNIFDIANAMQAAGLGSRDDFLAVARSDLALISDLDPQAPSLEGYLFPDTYQFTRTQSLHDMAATMVKRFRQASRQLGLTTDFHRVVTMASIVEKETAVPSERPLVASVFYNRLSRKIVLATDPSVIYAALLAGHYDGVIRHSDLQFDSPYNTYKHVGLPPGPICNPGRYSLQAAIQPASSDFLYFVSDNNGHHRFARTLQEHARNVAAYRRAVAESH